MTLDVAALREAIHFVTCDRPEGYAKHAAGTGARCQLAGTAFDDDLIDAYRATASLRSTSRDSEVLHDGSVNEDGPRHAECGHLWHDHFDRGCELPGCECVVPKPTPSRDSEVREAIEGQLAEAQAQWERTDEEMEHGRVAALKGVLAILDRSSEAAPTTDDELSELLRRLDLETNGPTMRWAASVIRNLINHPASEAAPVVGLSEGWPVLAHDLSLLDDAQYRQVAEWMIEHGWTEPLDPGNDREPRCRYRSAYGRCVRYIDHDGGHDSQPDPPAARLTQTRALGETDAR